MTPGRSGTEARKRPSSSRSISTRIGSISTIDSFILHKRRAFEPLSWLAAAGNDEFRIFRSGTTHRMDFTRDSRRCRENLDLTVVQRTGRIATCESTPAVQGLI